MLHRLRPFVLERESTNFKRVAKILRRALPEGRVRDLVDSVRSQYSGELMQRAVVISVGETIVNSEHTLTTWLNAWEYHRDEDKQLEIGDLQRALPTDVLNYFFLHLLGDKIKAISNLRELIALIMRKQKTLQIG